MDDDIIRMAREADREWDCDRDMVEWLEWFAALVRADERKRIKAEPVEPVAWVGDPSTQDYASTVPDPQIADRLARHGIPMPEGDPKC